jgi:hypothetical protein
MSAENIQYTSCSTNFFEQSCAAPGGAHTFVTAAAAE